MKYNIIKALLVVTALFAAVACSQDNKMETYPSRNDEVFFKSAYNSYLMGPTDAAEYTIPITRAVAVGEATISVGVSGKTASLFNVPKTLNFKDGSFTCDLKITFDRTKLNPGEANDLTITVGETKLPYYPTTVVSITRDYDTWKVVHSGSFASSFFADPWPQTLEQAIDLQGNGIPVYRFPDLFEVGYEIRFTVNKNGSITPNGAPNEDGSYFFESGFIHPSYGPVWIDIMPEDFEYDVSKKSCSFFGFFYCAAGLFGYKTNELTWN